MSSEKLNPLPELGDSSGMNLQETELTLGLPGGENRGKAGNKRAFSETVDLMNLGRSDGEEAALIDSSAVSDQQAEDGISGVAPKAPATKAQVVGWPPVRSFRKNVVIKSCKYVKVAADGAPFLRKVDLEIYGSYDELLAALEDMFSCARGHVATYEDKDGDWMLVGDVPWKMFVETCKRLRLMKSSEALGFAPRTPDLSSASSS